ncbi:MAG: RNA polymerase sigma factor [Bacteroidetes bacterium]|nr:RNA polymerase sigma factor [Bacteroidota bacterium]
MTIPEYNNCVEKYSDGVYRFILKNIKDSDKAKDIVQESFVRLWDKVKEVDYQKAKSYLFTIAYHCSIDEIRKDQRMISMEEMTTYFDSTMNTFSDHKEIINEAVDRLPEIQKSVVLLRDYEGYSYKEIGEITNLSEAQVKVYIYRARIFLKKYLVRLDVVI